MKIEFFDREKTGKEANRKLRESGKIPAILYGKKKNFNLSVSQSRIQSIFLETEGKKKILTLASAKENKKAIIQDYQYSRIKRKFLHLDFLEVTDDTVINLEIPVRTKGTSIVSKMGGIEQVIRHAIPIKCKAKNIPDYIDIDVSTLDFGGSIHVLDIPYPEGVKPVVTGRNFTIISTSGVASEVVEKESEEKEPEEADAKQTETEEKK